MGYLFVLNTIINVSMNMLHENKKSIKKHKKYTQMKKMRKIK